MVPASRIGAYIDGATTVTAEGMLLKLFRDKNLMWGHMLLGELPANHGVTQDKITLAHITAFTRGEDPELSRNKYSLLTMMMVKMPIPNGQGMSPMTNNPYRLDTADLTNVKRKINQVRGVYGLPALDITNTQLFIEFIESIDHAFADLLDGLMGDLIPELKKSGREQTKQSLDYLTKAIPVPTVQGVVGAFGDMWREGERRAHELEQERAAAEKARLDATDPGRALQGSELNKCGTLYKQLLEQNLKLLMQTHPAVAVRYNDIIRRAIDAGGAGLPNTLRTALRHIAVYLKEAGLMAQANSLLASLEYDFKLRNEVPAKGDVAKLATLFVRASNNLRLRVNDIFSRLPAGTPVTPETERLGLYLQANPVNQVMVTGLMDDLAAHPGDLANENQQRLARRVAKYLAAQEDYLVEARFAAEHPDAADPVTLNFLYDKVVRHREKFVAKSQDTDEKTYYFTPRVVI